MKTYKLWTYDVWGNEEEGFTVNDRHHFDTTKATDIDKALANFNKKWILDGLEDTGMGDETVIYMERPNGKPYCEITEES